MSQLRDFPAVDEDTIASLGSTFGSASTEMSTARGEVRAVAGSGSWESPGARPAYDSAIDARVADLRIAREALDHVGRVLEMTAREIETSRSQYDSANYRAFFVVGDPYLVAPGGGLEGLLDPDRPAPDPDQVRQFERLIARANQAADDAEYALAVCANELLTVSTALDFPEPPEPGTATSPDHSTSFIFPIAPAWGMPQGAVTAGGVQPPQFRTGRAFEARVLRELGIGGDRKSLFRPDAQGRYNLPRTRSGLLYRGVFPDSLRAGILEVKSGTTEVRANSPQIRVMRWVARILGVRFNLIVDQNTPVRGSLVNSIDRRGGAVLRRLGGGPRPLFWDEGGRRVVRADGAQGPRGDDLRRTPLSPDEVRRLPQAVRDAIENLRKGPPGGGTGGPSSGATGPGSTGEGPAAPYVSRSDYDRAWDRVTVPAPPRLPTGPIVPFPGPVPFPPLPPIPVPAWPFPVPALP